MHYRMQSAAPRDGKGTFVLVDVASSAGTWRSVGVTRTFRAYPSAVRAASEAASIARKHAKGLGKEVASITWL